MSNRSADYIADGLRFGPETAYSSKVEMYADMKDPRYATDLEFRTKCEQKQVRTMAKFALPKNPGDAGPVFAQSKRDNAGYITTEETSLFTKNVRSSDGKGDGQADPAPAVRFNAHTNGIALRTDSEIEPEERAQAKPNPTFSEFKGR